MTTETETLEPVDLRNVTVAEVQADMAEIVRYYGYGHRAPRWDASCKNTHWIRAYGSPEIKLPVVDDETGEYTEAPEGWKAVPSCIVGTWLWRRGVTYDHFRKGKCVGASVGGVGRAARLSAPVKLYLADVQAYQDGTNGWADMPDDVEDVSWDSPYGREWGKAVEYANAREAAGHAA